MRQIAIDLDVHRTIENGRLDFQESDNDILRRLLAIDGKKPAGPTRPRIRLARSSGAYSLMLGPHPIEANSLKELLRRVILMAEQMRPGFIEALSGVATTRGRHIVAPSPDGLYPRSPQLTEYAEKLDAFWWYDTNVGRNQVQSYLKLIAGMLKLASIPAINKRSEKSSLEAAEI